VSREYHHPSFSLSLSSVHCAVGHNASRWSMIQSHQSCFYPIQYKLTHDRYLSLSLNAIIIAYRLEGHASIEHHHHQEQEDALEREMRGAVLWSFVDWLVASLLRCVGLSLVSRVRLHLDLLDWRLEVGESLLVVAVRESERDTGDWSRDGRRCSLS